jgi:hypothetical protein
VDLDSWSRVCLLRLSTTDDAEVRRDSVGFDGNQQRHLSWIQVACSERRKLVGQILLAKKAETHQLSAPTLIVAS